MKFNEAAVFKWVVIVVVAGALIVAVTLLTRPLVGSLLLLAIVIAGCVYAYRWWKFQKRH
jgi:membrane protein DedA with SNARE-associated domain